MFIKMKNTKKANSALPFIFVFFLFLASSPVAYGAELSPPTPNPQGVSVTTPDQTQLELQKNKIENWKATLKRVGAVAYKNALSYFLKTIAIDTATYLASGGEG